MSKIDEIKIALSASKLGPMYKADFDANAAEYIAYLLEENERLRKQLDGTADLIKVKDNALTQLKDANDELTAYISKQAKELEEAQQALDEPRRNLLFKYHNERNRLEAAQRESRQLFKELEEARKIEFPRQMEGRGGWKIDYNFIEQVQKEVEHLFSHDISSFEQIEAVLLAIENLAAGQKGELSQ